MLNETLISDTPCLEVWDEHRRRWVAPVAGMYKEAKELLSSGLFVQALEEANRTLVEHYGKSHGCFRIVSERVVHLTLSPCHKFSE